MSLDTLYGAGATLAFEQALPGAKLTQADNPVTVLGPSVHVTYTWGQQYLTLDCHEDFVNFSLLTTTCGDLAQREPDHASFKAICAALPPLLRSKGIHRLRARPVSDETRDVLLHHHGQPEAFKELENGVLEWVL